MIVITGKKSRYVTGEVNGWNLALQVQMPDYSVSLLGIFNFMSVVWY
jgi:hypothetical protein